MQREMLFRITGAAMITLGVFLTVLSALDSNLLHTAGWLLYTLCGGVILHEMSDEVLGS